MFLSNCNLTDEYEYFELSDNNVMLMSTNYFNSNSFLLSHSALQDNVNLLLTEEEMYSLIELFKQCKIIPGELLRTVFKTHPGSDICFASHFSRDLSNMKVYFHTLLLTFFSSASTL